MTYNQKIPPFKWFILENFPYIEEDFDALTNWQLFCKLGKEMNKIIEKCNLTGEQVERLTTAFNELKTYVDEYFENLDIQDEVDTKLDEMAQSGQLAELISQYLEAQAIIGFNTCSGLSQATNLADGSFARTLGRNTYKDGFGAFYKIRTRTNQDVPDGYNIIELTNTTNLVAERVVSQIEKDIQDYKNFDEKRSIFIGDSYAEWNPDEGTLAESDTYWYKFFKMNGIDEYYSYHKGGVGFYQQADNKNFQDLLEDHFDDIPNKDTIRYIFVMGGYNDSYQDSTSKANVSGAISNFVSYCKTNYPNAKVIIGQIGYDTNRSGEGDRRRNNLNAKITPAYANTSYNYQTPYTYLPNLNYCLHTTEFMASDGIHPTIAGHTALANAMNSAFNKGYYQQVNPEEYVSNLTPLVTNGTVDIQLYIQNRIPMKQIRLNKFVCRFTLGNLPSFSFNQTVELASYNSKLLLPTYEVKFRTTCLFKDNSNHYTVAPVQLIFSTNKIKIRIELLNSAGNNWQTLSNIEYMEIMQTEFTTTMDIL